MAGYRDAEEAALREECEALRARVQELEGAGITALNDLWRLQDLWQTGLPDKAPPAAFLNSYLGAVNVLRGVLGSPVKPSAMDGGEP